MARKFFYICAGMLMLALSFYLGATTATAQAPGNPVVGIAPGTSSGYYVSVAANGDCYFSDTYGGLWRRAGNVFTGGATPAQQESWGQLKSRYAPNGGTVSKGADTR